MTRRSGWLVLARIASLALCLAAGCTSAGGREDAGAGDGRSSLVPYHHDRRDYLAFREAYPALLEPNYLPFMVHRITGPSAGDLLIFCRWPASSMPLRFYISEPVVEERLQDEFRPIDPALYTEAVEQAVAIWEAELEGLVTFERVADPDAALLRFSVLAEQAPTPEPDVRVLGSTEALHRACQPHGWHPDEESLKVSFAVAEAVVYAVDEFGLLTPAQVLAITLHEIGHVLGMMGHSPVSTDLMYRELAEGTARTGLAVADVNSFVSLYQLPNGSFYGEVPADGPPPPPARGPPSGEPVLSVAPYVDARHGFEVRTPAGWLRAGNEHGLFAANGPIWDHEASFEIFVWPYASIEEFLERFSASLFANTWHRYRTATEIDGRRALEISVEDPSGTLTLDFFFIEIGAGRVMVVLASSPVDVSGGWRPWFMTALASLEIWSQVSDEGKSPTR